MPASTIVHSPHVMQRILHDTVKVAGRPLEPETRYKVATTAYLALGKDGYDAFKDPEVKLLGTYSSRQQRHAVPVM